MRYGPFVTTIALLAISVAPARAQVGPVIDVHRHAWAWNDPAWADWDPDVPANEANRPYLEAVLAEFDAVGVVLAVVSGPDHLLDDWTNGAPGRILLGPEFPCVSGLVPPSRLPCFDSGADYPTVEWLRQQYESGRFHVMGELTNQYAGVPFGSEAMAPYWRLAEAQRIPVAVHVAGGPPQTAQKCCPAFRLGLGDPINLEEVLVRHPTLRVHLMHADILAYPHIATLLLQFPNVYVDLSPYQFVFSRRVFHDMLRVYQARGLLNRVMFGSDGMPLRPSIEAYRSATFLSEAELRGIFCENAASFLRRRSVCAR